MNRFDYVKYDDQAATTQAKLKVAFEQIEDMVELDIANGRAKALVMTKLEEAYMWVGKAIRDEQLTRGPATLQEERNDTAKITYIPKES